MIRRPAVAGQFYPGDPHVLREEIGALIKTLDKEKAVGVVSPHAGYVYSGSVAGEVFSSVEIPKDVVVLSVNHRLLGRDAAIMVRGAWDMPNGKVPINEDLAGRILELSGLITDDPGAHSREHSLEVQLPFLQYLRPDFQLVPITFQQLSYDQCAEAGESIARAVKAHEGDVLIVASNDMTHFEPADVAEGKDRLAIDRILNLDPAGLLKTVREHRISMCGVIPTTVMLLACKALGASRARLVRYTNSGAVTGNYSDVVAYAGLIIQ